MYFTAQNVKVLEPVPVWSLHLVRSRENVHQLMDDNTLKYSNALKGLGHQMDWAMVDMYG